MDEGISAAVLRLIHAFRCANLEPPVAIVLRDRDQLTGLHLHITKVHGIVTVMADDETSPMIRNVKFCIPPD